MQPRSLVLRFWSGFPTESLAGQSIVLTPSQDTRNNHKRVWTIGRASACDFVIDKTLVSCSRIQCSIIFVPQIGWLLQDGGQWESEPLQGSRNGTYYRNPNINGWIRYGGKQSDHNWASPLDPAPLFPGCMIGFPVPGQSGGAVITARILVSDRIDDTDIPEIWADEAWTLHETPALPIPQNGSIAAALRDEALSNVEAPWYASLAVNVAAWLQTPTTFWGAIYRLSVIILIMAFTAMILYWFKH